MVSVCQDKCIYIYDLESRAQTGEIQLGYNISSVALSQDGRYALVNLACGVSMK
jgi:hypothetical protein